MFCTRCDQESSDQAGFCAACGAALADKQVPRKLHLSTAAGIIDIVLGLFAAVWTSMVMAVAIVMVGGIPTYVVLLVLAFAALGLLGAVGGIFALRRRHWLVALAGAILLVLPSGLLGIGALVLTIMARDEFDR